LASVLADCSVWIAHFRKPNRLLHALLSADQVLCHPLIVLELACGTPPVPRERTLKDLQRLRQSVISTTEETLALIQREQLHGLGCGAVDMSLLASVLLTSRALLWTDDKHLAGLAAKMGVAFSTATG
jgi:predicted nucleic acid-binding protein